MSHAFTTARRRREGDAVTAIFLAWLRGVLQAEHLTAVVVGEQLGIPTPADDGLEGLLGRFLGHVILELVEKAALGRPVTCSLVQDATDVGGQGDIVQ
jgi:hypothetical protein